jgi:hypothetical protein
MAVILLFTPIIIVEEEIYVKRLVLMTSSLWSHSRQRTLAPTCGLSTLTVPSQFGQYALGISDLHSWIRIPPGSVPSDRAQYITA